MENESLKLLNGSNDSLYERPFTDVATIVSSSIILPLCLFGIVANLITLAVLAVSPNLKTTFNYLLMSLCVSDILSAVISPLFLYRRTWGFDDWKASDFLCRLIWGVDLWTSYVTSTHILLFALIRFVSLKSPSAYYKLKISHIKVIIAVVWFVTFCIGFIPMVIMIHAKVHDRSGDTVDAKWPSCTLNVYWVSVYRNYTMIAYSIMYYVPMILIFIFSAAIAVVLRQKRRKRKSSVTGPRAASSGLNNKNAPVTLESKRRRKEKQIVIQLGLILGSFFCGYLPQTAYHFYTTSTVSKSQAAKVFDWRFGMAIYICLRVSECLNPIFYNLASRKMRHETLSAMKCCGGSPVGAQLAMHSTPRSSDPTSRPREENALEI